MKAKVIMDQRLVLGKDDRYTVFLKVFEVQKSQKFPDGIKAKFVLVDTLTNSPHLLIDNHEPFGFMCTQYLARVSRVERNLKSTTITPLCAYFGRKWKGF